MLLLSNCSLYCSNNMQNEHKYYDVMFAQLVICTVKNWFGGYSYSKKLVSNMHPLILLQVFLMVFFATNEKSLSWIINLLH